jgi:hypothetical protein
MWLGFNEPGKLPAYGTSNSSGNTTITAEFNSREACQSAAREIMRQVPPSMILCAEKEKKK